MQTMSPTLTFDPVLFQEQREAIFDTPAFNPRAGETTTITYTLTNPGIVRLFVRPKARRFVVVRTLLDWEPQEPGTHTVTWDGRDSKGNIVAPAACIATIETQPLRGTLREDEFEVAHDESLEHYHETHGRFIIDGEERWVHSVHYPEKCRQLKVRLLEPKPFQKIDGQCSVKVEISEDSRGYGHEVGHSARYYVDYMVLFEDKSVLGTNIAEWTWDTTGLPKGRHIFTAACCDHHDHMDSDSIVVEIV